MKYLLTNILRASSRGILKTNVLSFARGIRGSNPLVELIFLFGGILFVNIGKAESKLQVYPGNFLRKEVVAVHHNPFVKVDFIGRKSDNLAFQFTIFDRKVYEEQPVYEKILVRRSGGRNQDMPQRVTGETVAGDIVIREKTEETGQLPQEKIEFLSVIAHTDEEGILLDVDQVILPYFDDLKHRSLSIIFRSEHYGELPYELTRSVLYQKLGMILNFRSQWKPRGNVPLIKSKWDKKTYFPGDTAKLRVTLRKEDENDQAFYIMGRSVSRWDWLDGKMYYFGGLHWDDKKEVMRLFTIPEDTKAGYYFFRLTCNDYSGRKPYIAQKIRIKTK